MFCVACTRKSLPSPQWNCDERMFGREPVSSGFVQENGESGESWRGTKEKSVQTGEAFNVPGKLRITLSLDRHRSVQKVQRNRDKKKDAGKNQLHCFRRRAGNVEDRILGLDGLLIFRDQLGFGNLMRNCLWRIVKRELILQTPRENRDGQPKKQKGKAGKTGL